MIGTASRLHRDQDVAGAPRAPSGGAQRVERSQSVGIGSEREDAANQPIRRVLEHVSGGEVGVEDFQRARIEHQNRIAGDLEQQAVPRFHVAQPPVVTLHRLLGFDEPLLQRRHVTHIAADRHHRAVPAHPQRGIGHGNLVAIRQRVVDLPSFGRPAR